MKFVRSSVRSWGVPRGPVGRPMRSGWRRLRGRPGRMTASAAVLRTGSRVATSMLPGQMRRSVERRAVSRCRARRIARPSGRRRLREAMAEAVNHAPRFCAARQMFALKVKAVAGQSTARRPRCRCGVRHYLRRAVRSYRTPAVSRWPNRAGKLSADRVRGESMANRAGVRPRAHPFRRRRAAKCLLRKSVRSHLKRAASRRPKRVVKSSAGRVRGESMASRAGVRQRPYPCRFRSGGKCRLRKFVRQCRK